jgi:RNA polymerase sigma-70 factor, ECF subfamily
MENPNAEKHIETLFNENFQSLVFSSFRIIMDYEQAEDIVQNVFVKLWQSYDKIKHTKDMKPYIFKAVRNSSLNYLRDKKPNENNTMQIQELNIEYPEDNDEEPEKSEISQKIHQAVDKLPDNWREAFILSKYEKLKYYEIAEKMNISNKTVEKYISKALMFLRLELKYIVLSLLFLFF